jgi:hypothetical protein
VPTLASEDDAYQLAKQAYLYGYPLAYFARLRHTRFTQPDPITRVQQRWNVFSHLNAAITPATPGAPQTDTFYSRLWIDVSTEPLMIRIPATDGRYWSLQMIDYFGQTFGLPNRRSHKEASVIAVVSPGWRGSLPPEVRQSFTAPSPMGYGLIRMYFAGQQDQAKAVQVQTAFDARPLSAYLRGGDWNGTDGSTVFAPAPPAQDPLADFKAMAEILRQSPLSAADAKLAQQFTALGLGQGAVALADLPEHVRKGMARAEAEVRQLIIQTTRAIPGARTANGWVNPKPSIGIFKDGDHMYRAACALFGTICTPVDENVYVVAQHEPGFTQRLQGSKRYELFFSKEMVPKAAAFWSVHAYTDRYTLIPNPQQRYSVGDRTAGLQYGADGSLRILLQADAPSGNPANWIATQRDQPFSLVVRAYEPLGAIKDLSWAGPEIRLLA